MGWGSYHRLLYGQSLASKLVKPNCRVWCNHMGLRPTIAAATNDPSWSVFVRVSAWNKQHMLDVCMSMGFANMFHMRDNFASKNLQLRTLQECWCSVLLVLKPEASHHVTYYGHDTSFKYSSTTCPICRCGVVLIGSPAHYIYMV